MGDEWLWTPKPSFLSAWRALPPKETHQVLEKITLLEQDPMPDGKAKIQVKRKYQGKIVYRIRCGVYRIFYTFRDPYISLLALLRRDEDTYNEDLDVEFLGGFDVEAEDHPRTTQPNWERIFAPLEPEKKRLPEPVTEELLANLHIPKEYHARLLAVATEDDLLDCPGVPNDHLSLLLEYMFPKPLDQIIQQPDYLLDECLKFQGRTSALKTNYRSTREIGEATQSYLAAGALETEAVEHKYMNNGPLPVVRSVPDEAEEVDLLARFLPGAAREFRLGLGSCAVFCPTEKSGEAIAAQLAKHGVNATFMKGRELDLSRPGVKVLTLNSSKGLEFPVIALAGFAGSHYALVHTDNQEGERDEALARERRTIFVGMTRAMRALLVVVPAHTGSPLLTGFDPKYWNLGS